MIGSVRTSRLPSKMSYEGGKSAMDGGARGVRQLG